MFATADVQKDCEQDGMSMVEEYEEDIGIGSPNDSRLVSLLGYVVEVENYPGVSFLLVRHQLVDLTNCYLKHIMDQIIT